MYKNEYLNKCLKEKVGSYYLLSSYKTTQDKNLNELIIDDLGFIYKREQDLKELKIELTKANIKEFVLTVSSSGLMDVLYALNKVGIKINGVTEIRYQEIWNKEERIIKGLKMIVE